MPASKRIFREAQDNINYFCNRFNQTIASGSYENYSSEFEIKCNACGKKHRIGYASIKKTKNYSCRWCANSKLSPKLRLEKLKDHCAILGYEYMSGEYIDNKSLFTIRCDQGHEFKTTYSKLFNNKIPCIGCREQMSGMQIYPYN